MSDAKPWEKYSAPAVEAGPWAKYQAPEAPEAPAKPSAQTLAVRKAVEEREGKTGRNIGMGLFKSVQGVGDTVINAGVAGAEAVRNAVTSPSLSDVVTGQRAPSALKQWNNERIQSTDNLFKTQASENTLAFQGGKLAGDIAITAPVGGAIANVATKAVPALATVAPGLVSAIRTGGMTAGPAAPGVAGTLANLGTRAAGGAITGGVSAGLVNPNEAGTGAVVGAALPGVLQAVGKGGQAVGRVFRGPEQAPDVAAAVTAARNAGYVIPPTQARPTLLNRLAEGFSGKITTAQNASAKNQAVTNGLAAAEVGLPVDAPITKEALNSVREEAGKAYQALAKLPERPAVSGSSLMNREAVEGFSPKQALQDLRQARNDATSWYTAYARSASPDDQAKAKAAASVASKIEQQFEDYAKSLGRDDLVPAMQEARKLIAKTYTIEKALNPTTGSVDAKKLGAMVTKGKPLSGGLKEAGDFANRFPKAAQTIEGMGSLPQTSPLDWAAGGGISAATGNPLMLAGVLARPAARKLTLSEMVQNRLVQPPPGAPSQTLSGLSQLGYRAAPAIAADR